MDEDERLERFRSWLATRMADPAVVADAAEVVAAGEARLLAKLSRLRGGDRRGQETTG